LPCHTAPPLLSARGGCGSAGDASSFIQENRALKLQLDRLVAERDDLRSKVSTGGWAHG